MVPGSNEHLSRCHGKEIRVWGKSEPWCNVDNKETRNAVGREKRKCNSDDVA